MRAAAGAGKAGSRRVPLDLAGGAALRRGLGHGGLLASRLMAEHVYVGNTAADAPNNCGWVLGHFMPAGDIRHSQDVEIKWGVRDRGDQRAQWVTGERRTAMITLISGRFRVDLPERSVLLRQQGDYIVFHGADHSWYAEEDSVVMGARWPSVPGYATPHGTEWGFILH
jgi:hypothetical protein